MSTHLSPIEVIREMRKQFEEKYPSISIGYDGSEADAMKRDEISRHINLILTSFIEAEITYLEGERKNEKVCAYCLDSYYMKVNGKLKRGCVWCENGRKKEELEPDQLTSLDTIVSFNSALSSVIEHLQEIKKQI